MSRTTRKKAIEKPLIQKAPVRNPTHTSSKPVQRIKMPKNNYHRSMSPYPYAYPPAQKKGPKKVLPKPSLSTHLRKSNEPHTLPPRHPLLPPNIPPRPRLRPLHRQRRPRLQLLRRLESRLTQIVQLRRQHALRILRPIPMHPDAEAEGEPFCAAVGMESV